ncbi:hypothetical protein Esti_002532 [Eimeria stiedai]
MGNDSSPEQSVVEHSAFQDEAIEKLEGTIKPMTSVKAGGSRIVGDSAERPNRDPLEGNTLRLTQAAVAPGTSDPEDVAQECRRTQGSNQEPIQPEGSTSGRESSQVASSQKRRSTRESKRNEEVWGTAAHEILEGATDRPLADSSAGEGNSAAVVERLNPVELGTQAEAVITDEASPRLGETRDIGNPDLADKPDSLSPAHSAESALRNSNARIRRRSVSQTSGGMHSRHSNASNRPHRTNSRDAQSRTRSAGEGRISQSEQREKANNLGALIWEMSEESSQNQQDTSDEAVEDSRRDRMLWIWVGSLSLGMAILFICLTYFAINGSQHEEETVPIMMADCEVGAWSEWTVCPVACGDGTQTRLRVVTAAPGTSSGCPTQQEERRCSGSCNVFIITREASKSTTSLSSGELISDSQRIRNTLALALGVSSQLVVLLTLGLDSSIGTKYWRVQFLVQVDRSLPNNDPNADLGSDPQRVLQILEKKMLDYSKSVYRSLDNLLPGLDPNSPFRLQSYKATLSTLTESLDMCILLGPEAPETCACKVSEWSEWTICDQHCAETVKSTRARTILGQPQEPHSSGCPPLAEERGCTGETKLYSISLPAGVDLGSTSDAENRLNICKQNVLQKLMRVCAVSAPEHAVYVGSSEDKTFWKYSLFVPNADDPAKIKTSNQEALRA